MAIQTKEYSETVELDECRKARHIAKIEYDDTNDKVKSIKYYVETINICEKVTNVPLTYAVDESKFMYEGENPNNDNNIKIIFRGDFSKFLSVIEQRQIYDVESGRQSIALVLSQLIDKINAELKTKRFEKIEIKADDIEIGIGNTIALGKVAGYEISVAEDKGNIADSYLSIRDYLIELLTDLVNLASPEEIK